MRIPTSQCGKQLGMYPSRCFSPLGVVKTHPLASWDTDTPEIWWCSNPIGSMGLVYFTYMKGWFTSPMDSMGIKIPKYDFISRIPKTWGVPKSAIEMVHSCSILQSIFIELVISTIERCSLRACSITQMRKCFQKLLKNFWGIFFANGELVLRADTWKPWCYDVMLFFRIQLSKKWLTKNAWIGCSRPKFRKLCVTHSN